MLETTSMAGRHSKDACGYAYRNVGKGEPTWWPSVRQLFHMYQAAFPPGLSPAFVGAWIERESSGRHDVVSSLGEVGYFQLHPQEIDDLVGKERSSAVAKEVISSPASSMLWGGHYLSSYDKVLTSLGVARGTETYYGLLKAMHWNPVHTPRWVKHVRYGLGKIPKSYNAFINAAHKVKTGQLRAARGVRVPSRLPSCSAFYVLDRAPVFGKWPPKTSSVAAVFGIASVAILVAGAIGASLSQLGMGRYVAWKAPIQGPDTPSEGVDREPPS